MKRKKILFIPRWYPDRNDPMLGLFVQKHAQAVSLLHDVCVVYVTADTHIPQGKTQITENSFENIFEIRIYFGKAQSRLINFLNYLRCYLKGVHLALNRFGKPAISHVHILSRTALPAIYLRFRYNIPYVITEHWSRYLPVNVSKGGYRGLFRKLFTRYIVRSASAVTTVTQNLADAMQNLGLKNQYFITPNVADTSLFRPSENSKPNEVKKLIHVSCFDEPAKNIKGIINVVEKLSVQRNDFILEIIGNGVDFKQIKEYSDNKNLTGSRVFFTGLLTGEELASHMREADAMVMFSNYENLPCTIVESICSGVPVVSTDVGGIREHINRASGILIERGDENELYHALLTILNDSLAFNTHDMRSYGIQQFSMNALAVKFDDIYNNIN